MALRKQDRTSLEWILNRTPPIPDFCQWCIFLRNHDELTLEMVTDEEREWMWQEYAPEPRMRLNLGIRRRLAPLLDNDRRKIELANSLLFTMPGSPIIYYGDEIGMGDDIWLFDRNGVRTPMQWDNSPSAGFSQAGSDKLYSPVISNETYGPSQVNVADQLADPDSLLNLIRHMISTRKQQRAFGWGTLEWVEDNLPGSLKAVASYLRSYGSERLLIVNNLSSAPQSVVLSVPGGQTGEPVDLLFGAQIPGMENGKLALKLKPYQYLWLKL